MVKYITKLETAFLIEYGTHLYEKGDKYTYLDNREVASRDLLRYLIPYLQKKQDMTSISQSSATERIKPLKIEGGEGWLTKSQRSYTDGAAIEIYYLTEKGKLELVKGLDYLVHNYPHLKPSSNKSLTLENVLLNFKKLNVQIDKPER